MKTFILILLCIISTSASHLHMYLKDVIDNSNNIIIAKVISLEAKGNVFSKAKIQTLEVLKGTASAELSFKPNPSWIRDRKNIHNGEILILLFNEEKHNHTIRNFIRMNSFLEDSIRNTELLYWISYPAQLQHIIAKNDSIYQKKILETNDEFYNHRVVPFDTLLQIIKSSIVAPPLLKVTKRFYHKFIIAPNIYLIKAFIKENKNFNLIDSIALFDGKYLPGLKEQVVIFNLGGPNATFEENGMTVLSYSDLLNKEFMFKNDSLILIREIKREKRALGK